MVSYSGYHRQDIPKGAVDPSKPLFVSNIQHPSLPCIMQRAVTCYLPYLQWRYINNNVYNPILGLIKISFCLSLIKLRSPREWVNRSLWALVVINTMFIIAATFGSIFRCWPVKKRWYPKTPGTCGSNTQYTYSVVYVTIITDVLVTIIPAAILYGLQMPRRHKVTAMIFLSLPIGVTAIGVYRLYNFYKVFNLPKDQTEDPYNVRNALSNIESNLGVIAACGPTIKWILGTVFPYFRSQSARPSHVYSTNESSRHKHATRGYQKSHDDIELTIDGFDHVSPDASGNLQWKMKDSDTASDERAITGEEGITKTTVVDWRSESGAPIAASTPRDIV